MLSDITISISNCDISNLHFFKFECRQQIFSLGNEICDRKETNIVLEIIFLILR
jgi:hypothetical protein